MLGSIQYPSAARCSQTGLSVGRRGCVHPGWHSVLSHYDMARASRPFDPFAVFAPVLATPKPGHNSHKQLSLISD